ncbi:MAG TPA: hypothetical protein VFG41_03765, partial [Sphingomicrobium sp.]|nr:hypothetical protein [Sphingomicrobium sp.]
MNQQAAPVTAAAEEPPPRSLWQDRRRTGSLTRRMIGMAALWIAALLLIGGFALDRVLSRTIVETFDTQLVTILKGMLGAAEIGPSGEVRFSRALADQRFVEAYSGLYYQVTEQGVDPLKATPDQVFPSRSLWDRRLRVDQSHTDLKPHIYDSDEFSAPGHPEPIRVAEQDAILPGSPV